MSLLLKRESAGRGGLIALVLLLSAGTGAGLLLWDNPLGLLLAAGGACAAAIGLYFLRRPLAALYVALLLYLIPYGVQPPEFDLAYTILANGAIALALCAWVLQVPSQRQPVVWDEVCLLIFVYIVWASVTLLWAPDLIEARHKLAAYCIGLILLFLVVQQVRTLRAVDGLMRILAMTGWMLVIAGVLTLLFTDYQFGTRLRILDLNENAFGTLLTLLLSGVIWPVLRTTGARRSLYLVLSIVFILWTVILVLLNGSRGSTLSMVIILLAFWFWKPLRPWAIMGTVLGAGMLAIAPFLLDSLTNRSMGDQAGGRITLWRASWHLIQDHPLTGMGVGNGRSELQRYIGLLTREYSDRYFDPRAASFRDQPSHNPLLEVGVDTGIFGMLLYASICVSALWRFFRHRGRWYMREGPLAAYCPMILCIGSGYFVSCIEGAGMENHPTFFMLLALLIIPSQLASSVVSHAKLHKVIRVGYAARHGDEQRGIGDDA